MNCEPLFPCFRFDSCNAKLCTVGAHDAASGHIKLKDIKLGNMVTRESIKGIGAFVPSYSLVCAHI